MTQGDSGQTSAVLSTLFEALPVGVLAEDNDRQVLAVNQHMFDMFGFPGSPDTIIGRDCIELAHETSELFEEPSEFVQQTNELVQDHDGMHTETWELTDGRTFTRTYQPIELPEGDGHLWVYRDISEKTAQENKLKETTSRLAALFENSPDLINILDPDGIILDVNDRFCDELGYTESELIGRPIWEIDQHVEQTAVQELLASFAEGDRERFEGRYERVDGTTLPVEVHLLRLDLDGEDRFVAMSRNISERKTYETGFTALHATAQQLLRAETPHEVAEIINSALVDILDMPLNGVFYYDQLEDTLQPAAVTTQGEQMLEDIPSFGPGTSLAWEVFETGDSQRYRDVSTAPGRYNPETPFRSELIVPLGDHGIILIGSPEIGAFDVRDQSLVETLASHAEAVLDRLSREQELESKNERLDEFASVVSHDLRNPLNVARGRLELAREEHDSDHLEVVARALQRSQNLIEDLRTLTRTGSIIGPPESIDLSELSEQCWKTIATQDASLERATTRRIEGDRSRIRQLIENLFRNAIKHGGDNVTIRIGDLPDGFYIEDDGTGIPVEERETIFEAGYTTTTAGTGFGLNIVEQIAIAHDWDIQVRESSSGGARFEFTNVTPAET